MWERLDQIDGRQTTTASQLLRRQNILSCFKCDQNMYMQMLFRGECGFCSSRLIRVWRFKMHCIHWYLPHWSPHREFNEVRNERQRQMKRREKRIQVHCRRMLTKFSVYFDKDSTKMRFEITEARNVIEGSFSFFRCLLSHFLISHRRRQRHLIDQNTADATPFLDDWENGKLN